MANRMTKRDNRLTLKMTVKLTAAALANRQMSDKQCIASVHITYLVLHQSWSAPKGRRSFERSRGSAAHLGQRSASRHLNCGLRRSGAILSGTCANEQEAGVGPVDGLIEPAEIGGDALPAQ